MGRKIKKNCVYKSLYYISFYIILASFLHGCKDEVDTIGGPVMLSPQKDYLVFRVLKNHSDSAGHLPKLCVLNLIKKTYKTTEYSCQLTSLGWRLSDRSQELFIEYNNKLFLINVPETQISDWTKYSGEGFICGELAWSPNGQTLAMAIVKGKENVILGIVNYGQRTIIETSIPIGTTGRFFWIDNNSLYVEDKNLVLEISTKNNTPEIVNKTTFEKQANLLCVWNRKFVYSINNEVYCDGNLLYHADEKVTGAESSNCYLAIKSKNILVVIDDNKEIIAKRLFSTPTNLIGIDASNKSVYLMENKEGIQQYFFKDNRLDNIY